MAILDNTADSRFDEAESDVDRGEPWRYRDADAPNPLTIEVTEWSTGITKLGEAEFMNGTDRSGKRCRGQCRQQLSDFHGPPPEK